MKREDVADPKRRYAHDGVELLLVADDPQFAELLRAQLRRMGWPQTLMDGAGSLATARAKLAGGGAFSLVITDLNLPDCAGPATVAALAAATDAPVVVLTGEANPAVRAAALQQGAHDFLSKDQLSASALERLLRLASLQASTLQRLRESESRFRDLIALSSDFYWETDAQHRMTHTTHADKHQPASAPVLGKTRWEVPSVYPDEAGWARHRATLDARRPFRDFEMGRIDPGGELRFLTVSGEPVFDAAGVFKGYRGVGRDITARKRAEEELSRFRLAMDNSADMIVLIDRASMRFVDVNRTMCTLLGYSREEMLAMGPQDILPVARAGLEQSYDQLIADPSLASGMKSHYRCKDGSLLPFESTRHVLRSGERWLIAAISRDVRERLAAEEALRESEARFRSLTQLSSDWYWEQDAEFRLTFMSRLLGEKTGLEASQYLGRRRWDQPALNLTETDWARHQAQLARHEPFRDFEMERPAPDGGSRWLSLSGEPVFDAEGQFTGYRGVGRDITERKHAERDLRHLSRMYAALGGANEAILRAQSAAEVFERACRIAVEAGGFLLGTVYVLDPQGGSLSRVAASGPAAAAPEAVPPSIDPDRPAGQGLMGHACRLGERIIANDYPSDPRSSKRRLLNGQFPVGSGAVFPIRVDGGLAGAFGLLHEQKGAFTEELTALLQRLTDNIAFALEHFGQDQRRREAERQLAQSEQRFRSLTGISSDMYWEQDDEHRFTVLSDAGPQWMEPGRRLRMLGKHRWDQHYFNMSEADWAAHRAVLDARQPFRDLELGRVNERGDKVWAAVSGEPVFDDAGRFRGYRGVGKDITARKRAEEALRESEARFRSLTQLSSDWFWQTDAEHRFVDTPDRVTQLTGMAANRYVGRRRWEVAGLSPVSGDWAAHRDVLARRESYRDLELVQVRPDGGRVYLQVSGEPVFNADGSFQGYRGTARDITVGKREEEKLRRFRAAMDMSFDAIYLTDRSTMRFVDVNDAACRGVGYSREELLRMGPHEILSVPVETLEREYDAVIAQGERGTVRETSYVSKNGERRWTELHRRALRTPEGWLIVTISRDITERKSAEERKAAHLRYQERIARFGQAALGKRDSAELIQSAVQEVLEGLGAEAVAYVEPESGGLVLRAVVGVAEGAASRTLDCEASSPLVRAVESGTRQLADGSALPLAWARPLRSAALIPVRGERSVRGVLCALYAGPDAFEPDRINFAEASASVLSTGLQRIASEGRLAYLAQFDALTGLPNRALLADRFTQMIAQARRHAATLGVLFIDLDEFKMVNDTLGHAGGDELLKEVAVRLQACVRSGDTVARISGDEFAVVLNDLARAEDGAIVAQKIIDRLAAAVEIRGQEVFVTASVGIALFPNDGADAEGLIGAADAAMYRAKQSGRNAYQFFTAEINQRSRARAHLGLELRRALEREEFALVYQPKIRLADGGICGAEALLRWRHPERGTVSPAEFIPVLEETGLIVPVGEWVLRRACLDMKAWRAAGLAPGPVAVNLSARQFRLQDLDQRIKALVAEVGVDPTLLELEITESQLMQDPNHAIRVMRSLREAGISIAIDDFGTGYSSLAYLTRFPLASLKIDRSFVSDVKAGAQDATIVRTIIEMAHTLGFTVVAEGIENEYQAQYLRSHGCEQGQGFLFAKPMPANEFVARLSKT